MKQKVVPSYYLTNSDNHKICGNTRYKIIGFFNNYSPEKRTQKVEAGMIYGEAVPIKSSKSLFRGPVINGEAKYFRVLIQKV